MAFLHPLLFVLLCAHVSSVLATKLNQELKVLLFSDFHYDPLYKTNGTIGSFCRTATNSGGSSANVYGKYYCDTPIALLSSMINKTSRVLPSPDVILALGDFSAHFAPNEQVHREMIEMVIAKLRSAFPKTTILPVIGNNDATQNYAMPLTHHNRELTRLADIFSPLIGDKKEVVESLSYGGYYEYTVGKTTFVVMNTLLYFRNWKEALLAGGIPLGDIIDEEDPLGQWEWMEEVLERHKRQRTKVIIAGHIPPGVNGFDGEDSWTDVTTRRFQNLMSEYGEVVGGMVFGHYHQSEIKILRTKRNDRTLFGFVVPSFSLSNHNNPGMVILDVVDGMAEDYSVYYSNVAQANKGGMFEIEKVYTFSDVTKGTISHSTLNTLISEVSGDNKFFNIVNTLEIATFKERVTEYICAAQILNKEEYTECIGSSR